MKQILSIVLFVLFIGNSFAQNGNSRLNFFDASNAAFLYTGRFDFTNPKLPKVWAPGAHVTCKFRGNSCEIIINDEVLYGNSHNYITVAIDNEDPQRIKLKAKTDTLRFQVKGTNKLAHSLLVCKGTEAGMGYIEFVGIRAEELSKPDKLPLRKIECIGNSITCGTGSNVSEFPCGTGEWYDQHDAYMSYGAQTARILKADWVQSSVSGIGLMHSCCNMDRIMPDVIDKVNMNEKTSAAWDFSKYQPNVITIALGQNDGVQDEATFCKAYVDFLKRLRGYYPKATFICLTSPMADETLLEFMRKCLTNITLEMYTEGDQNVFSYYFSKRYHAGCGDHPSLQEHAEIAKELSAFIKKTMKW